MTGLVGAVVEAWDELRIHKLRVLLSLVGVAVAVTAITGATALVDMLQQGFAEQTDRSSGRQVTLHVSTWPADPVSAKPAEVDAVYDRLVERYGIDYFGRDGWTMLPVRTTAGTQQVQARVVDPGLGTIYRIRPVEGRWFADSDAEAYAPVLVVNEAMLAALGVSSLDEHPTVLVGSAAPVRATVVGVVADDWSDAPPSAFVLSAHLNRWLAGDGGDPVSPALALWVPAGQADALKDAIRRDVTASLPGYQVDVYDNRDAYFGGLDSAARWIGLGVGGFALLLGGLGLVNISLVTVRYRIREIGIRRSFGATGGRVFFGVLMESVVATVVAGLVGVVLAVAVVKAVPVDVLFGGYGLQDMPPFPAHAALIGMVAATGIGALAGVLPAAVAVRAKVIDAIRY